MKIEFKTGNHYLCTKDYIVNKQLAFRRNNIYTCKYDGILEGCNHEIYQLDNVDFKEEVFKNTSKLNDNVNHPKHYTSHPSGVECIQIARHYCFSIGNAIKYLWRAGLKQEASMTDKEKEIEDLKKAIFYINDRIKQLEESN